MNERDPRKRLIESALEESARLREENSRLRRLLAEHGIPIPTAASNNEAPSPAGELLGERTVPDKAAQRLALFRSLFRGREDVYAVRWENPDGRAGYAPKADRDWKAYLGARESDRRKVDRQTRKLRPLTDDVVRGHLMGKQTIGIYPLLLDETCWFLAVDFDKKTWQQDAAAFLETCREFGVPAALERSRSGRGGHVWIFFGSAVSAAMARKLGCAILTRTMERRHQVGLDSYDRFFPNQDTMPKGGFGNLIALPLQKIPREAGSSVSSIPSLDRTATNGIFCRNCEGCRLRPPRNSFRQSKARVISSESESASPRAGMSEIRGPCRRPESGGSGLSRDPFRK